VGQHVQHPARGSPVDRVHAADRATGDDFLDLLVVFAVAVLMADDGFHSGVAHHLHDFQRFVGGGRDRLLESDESGAVLHTLAYQLEPQVGERAETENVRMRVPEQCPCVRAGGRTAELTGCRLQATGIDVAEPDQLESPVLYEGIRVMHPAFAATRNDDGVFPARCHNRASPM